MKSERRIVESAPLKFRIENFEHMRGEPVSMVARLARKNNPAGKEVFDIIMKNARQPLVAPLKKIHGNRFWFFGNNTGRFFDKVLKVDDVLTATYHELQYYDQDGFVGDNFEVSSFQASSFVKEGWLSKSGIEWHHEDSAVLLTPMVKG